jgi:hypothetical protein
MDGLRRGAVGINRHSTDGIFFGSFYVFFHFARLAEVLDSTHRYRTLERVSTGNLAQAGTCETVEIRESLIAVLAPVGRSLMFCFLQLLFLGQNRLETLWPFSKSGLILRPCLLPEASCKLAGCVGHGRVAVVADKGLSGGRHRFCRTPILDEIFIDAMIGS